MVPDTADTETEFDVPVGLVLYLTCHLLLETTPDAVVVDTVAVLCSDTNATRRLAALYAVPLPKLYELMEQYKGEKELHIFKSREAAEEFLKTLHGGRHEIDPI